MLGPFATTSHLTPIQQMSLAVLSRAAHRCRQQRLRQHMTEGTAMDPWNGPNYFAYTVEWFLTHAVVVVYWCFVLIVQGVLIKNNPLKKLFFLQSCHFATNFDGSCTPAADGHFEHYLNSECTSSIYHWNVWTADQNRAMFDMLLVNIQGITQCSL